MRFTPTEIPEVVLVEPRVFGDARGAFWESFRADQFAAHGLPTAFVQDNVSTSTRGTIRGLHLQHPHGQGKLVSVLAGEVFDVAVDVRVGSPTFGRWIGVTLSDEDHRSFYVPPGFAHGFAVVSPQAIFAYKCTDTYHPETELGVRWDDPEIGIAWPDVGAPILSAKDAVYPRLSEIARERLPAYAAS